MAQIQVIDLLSEIAQVCRQCPTPTMVQAYVRAARLFCTRSRWLKRAIAGSTAADTEVYTLGSDPYVEIFGINAMSVEISSTEINPVTESYSGDWDTTDEADEPELYQYIPHGQFALHPIPDAIYPLVVSVVLQPKRGVNSLDDTLPVRWEYAFQAGALAYLLGLPGMVWTDQRESKVQEMLFRDWCDKGRSNAERGYNPGAAATGRPGQHAGPVQTTLSPF